MKGLKPNASFLWQLGHEAAWIAAQVYAMRRWVNSRAAILDWVMLQPHNGAMEATGAPIRISPRDDSGA